MSTRSIAIAGATGAAVIAIAHFRRMARCTPLDETPDELVKLCLSVGRGSKRAIVVMGRDAAALAKATAPGSRAVYPALTATTQDGWAVLDLHDYAAALQARGLAGDAAGKGEAVRSRLVAMSNRSLVLLAVALNMGRDDTFHFLCALAEAKNRRGDTAAANQLAAVATRSRSSFLQEDSGRSAGSRGGSPLPTRITRKSSSDDIEKLVKAVAVPPKLEVGVPPVVVAPVVAMITRKSSSEDRERLVKVKAVRPPNSRQ